MNRHEPYDAIVLGAGPAGLACSIALAQKGRRVLVLEQWPSLRDKACGDGLSIECVPYLVQLGIGEDDLMAAGAARIFRKFEYCQENLKETVYEKPCYGLSRKSLMGLLYEKARNCDVEIRFGVLAQKPEQIDGFYEVNGQFAAKNVVVATGAVSAFRPQKVRDLPFGISSRIRGKSIGADEHAYAFFYGPEYGNGYAWIFPIGKDLWNVGAWNGDNRKGVASAYACFEEKARAMIAFEGYDREPAGAFIGASRLGVDPVPNAIGDAAYLARYESGEGITYALASALAFAEGC